MSNIHSNGRIDWVDYAKGFCIVFVVMMHSTLGVEAAAGKEGWLHYLVEFARPFRMPDFFMISGLFLASVIDRDWRTYLDRKVVHFFYFYLLWMTIQFVFKAPGIIAEGGVAEVARLYLVSLIEPFGTLWFIYLLPICFVFVKLTKRVPWPVIWLAGAALEISHLETGWMVIDEFAARFVYFYTGYIAARHIFSLTARAQSKPWLALGGLALWGVFNAAMVHSGHAALPFYSLGMGLIGAAAIATVSSLLALHGVFKPLRYCGRNSIVVYLAFFLPMAVTRTALIRLAPELGAGWISVVVTTVAALSPLVLLWMIKTSGHGWFLFRRPAWAIIAPAPKPVPVAGGSLSPEGNRA